MVLRTAVGLTVGGGLLLAPGAALGQDAAGKDGPLAEGAEGPSFVIQLSSPVLNKLQSMKEEESASTSETDSGAEEDRTFLTERSLRLDLDVGAAIGDREVYDLSATGVASIAYNPDTKDFDPVARVNLSAFAIL